MAVSPATVKQYFEAILRVPPTPAQVALYSNAANVPALLTLLEGAAVAEVNPIIRLYQAAFNRVPDSNGFTAWAEIYDKGPNAGQPTATKTLATMTMQFATAPEFIATYGPNPLANAASQSAFIAAMYFNVLGRVPDTAEVQVWTSAIVRMQGQGLSNTAILTDVLNGFAQSREFIDKTAPYIQAFQANSAAGVETYTGTLWEQAGEPTQNLTVNQDNIVVEGALANTVHGVIGDSSTTTTNVGTYTLGDNISGNTLTKVDLLVAGSNTPYVTMSGVNELSFNAQASVDITLDGSNFGTDVSKVSATGGSDTGIAVQGLVTEGSFTLSTTPTFGGELVVGNVAFDNSGRMKLAEPNTLAGQDNTEYVGDNMVSDLYSENGVKANLYIASGTHAGGSSINLTEGEIEVNAGAGRLSSADNGDTVGAHVFHYVNLTDDLITADNISVDLVDINVAKGSAGEVVISNWADKTTDIGDAEALGVDVGSVDIAIADGSAAIFEVRNMASNTTYGFDASVNPAAYAGDVTVGSIDATAGTGSDVALKLLQLASLGEDSGHHGDETAQAGDLTVGDVTTNGFLAGLASLEVVNKVELDAEYVPPAGPAVGDYTGIVGNLEVGDVDMTGTRKGASVTLQNVIEFGQLSSGTGTADSTVGNTLVGDLLVEDGSSVSVEVKDGNQDNHAAQGSLTIGTMNVGSVDVASGLNATVNVDRNAIASDEDASIGVTNIAANGAVLVAADKSADFALNVLASATVTGDTDVAQVTVGDITLTAGSESNTADATADINVEALSAVKTNGSVAAAVAGVELGNVNVDLQSGNDTDGIALIDINVAAEVTPADGALNFADTATVGNVEIGNLRAFATATGATQLVDAQVKAVVDANSSRGDAQVGDVTIGNIASIGRDVAQATVTVSASADVSGDASVGDVVLGNVSVSNGVGGTSDTAAQFNLLVDADAKTAASVGGHTAAVSSVTLGNVNVYSADSTTDPNAVLDITVEAEAINGEASENVATVTNVAIGTLTAAALNTTLNSDAIIAVHVQATASGDASVDSVTVSDIDATAEGIAAVFVDQTATANNEGNATVTNVLIGNIDAVGETSPDTLVSVPSITADAVVWAEASADAVVGDALVDNIEIGNISATGVDDVNVSIDRIATAQTGDAKVDHITVGSIEATVSDTEASAALVINNIEAHTGGQLVSEADIVPPYATAGDASVKNVNLGTIDASGATVVAAQVVSATVESDTEGFVAVVDNVNIDDITVTDLGEGVIPGPIPSPVQDIAVAAVQVNAASNTFAIAVNKGEAYIRNLTIGDVTAEAAESVDGGLVGISVAVSATADHVGNVDDVTIGDLAITVNNDAEIALRVDVNANANKLHGADGNVGTAIIGDITVLGGENVTDYPVTATDTDNDVLDIVALDDIGTVTIGDWNIEIGAGSLLDDQDAVIAAGSGGSGYIESVELGDITRTATGAESVINSDIHIEADQQIQAVTIGNVTNTADGNAAEAAQAIHIGTGMGHGFVARPQAIGDIVIGNLTANASGAGVETASGTLSTTASIDVLVSASGDVESVTVGNIAATAEGFYSAANVAVNVNATGDVGPVEVGNLVLDISGTTATGSIDVGVNGIELIAPLETSSVLPTSVESLTVGNVTMNVFGDAASGTVDIHAVAGKSPVIDGTVDIGDLSITLGNDASARTPLPTHTETTSSNVTVTETVDAIANFTANSTIGGDLTIGNIDLTAQASVEGQLNSAGVQAHVGLFNHSADANVNIGDVTVVGGYYAQSGVTGATATTTGDLNGAIASYAPLVSPSVPTVEGGQTLYTQSALSYDFSYDQATDEWTMVGANVEAALTDFSFTKDSENVWTLSGTVSTFGPSELLTVTFNPDSNTVTYEWLAGDGIPPTWSAQDEGVATVDFTGALNNGDAISFSLATGGVFGPTAPAPAPLELLDNFNILDLESDSSWLQASAEGTGEVFIGDIDYSGYLATPAASGYTTYTAEEVTIDISGFGVSAGIQTIKFAQMDTNVTDNAGVQTFVMNSGTDTLTLVQQSHGAAGLIDTVNAFTDGTDTIILETFGSAGTAGEGSGDTYAAFVTYALANVAGTENLAFKVIGGNTYVAYDSTGTGLIDLNIVQITGVSLDGADFAAGAGDWVIS